MGCEYCDCCPTIGEHIAQHYDPDGLTSQYDNAEETLEIFRRCCDGEPCPLTVEDVHEYQEWIREKAGA